MARCLNGRGLNPFIVPGQAKMTQFASQTSPRPSGAAPSRPPAYRLARILTGLVLILLASPAISPLSGIAFAQSSELAGIQAKIRAYGCDLPQYRTSVAGCRTLHARAKALGTGSSSVTPAPARSAAPQAVKRKTYRSSSATPHYRRRPPPPSSSDGSLFGMLFSSRQSYRIRPMDRDYQYSTAPSYGAGYRTMCVRTCDGYYWPMSTSTVRGQFRADAQRCESSCNAPAKLFYGRGISGPAEHMVDLEGQFYSQLPNAFRYREEYVSDCRCKPDPWSEEAKADYEQRAVAEAAGETPALAANDAIEAAPRPVRRSAPRRRSVWETLLPFGRWSSGS